MQSEYDSEEQRDHIWDFLQMRLGHEKALHLKEHFETHVKDGGLEAAYLCLLRSMITMLELMNLSSSVHSFPAKWLLKYGTEEIDDGP